MLSNKRNYTSAIFTVCAILILSSVQASAWTEKQGSATLDDIVVEAENDVIQDITKSAFAFPMTAAIIDSFFTQIDSEIFGVSPIDGLQPLFDNPPQLASSQLPHPWLSDMATVPVVTFYPEQLEGYKSKSWELFVIDYRGQTFRSYKGKGKPKKVAWDGKGDLGSMLRVGYPYSYIFSVTDKGTNTYNYLGVSFRIPSVDYAYDSQRRLEFSGDEIFSPKATSPNNSGKEWLTLAADTIRRDHPRSPLSVVVVAEEQKLADNRATEIAEYLTESMILSEDWIEITAIAQPDVRAEMDGSVSIRIDHAKD
ncbi:MAG: hypothetical protein GY752_06405 [bacterium]|nr:hypothetical protein [bacterium]MCP4798973.1 hypothetical protein [bacterium]